MNLLVTRVVSLAVVLLQVLAIYAQEHNYTQYTIEDGLPTNYVYGVVEDDRGYIWAYTEQGIARFDGYEWKSFGMNDGLGTLDCYSMCPLLDGSFLVGGKGWPSIVKGDSIYKLPVSTALIEFDQVGTRIREGFSPTLSDMNGHSVIYSQDSSKLFKGESKTIFTGYRKTVFNSEEQWKEVERGIDVKSIDFNRNSIFVGKYGRHRFAFWGSPYHYFVDGKIIGEQGLKYPESLRGIIAGGRLQIHADSTLFLFDSTFMNITETIDMSSWHSKFDLNRVFRASNGDLWVGTRSNGLFQVRAESQRVKVIRGAERGWSTIEGVTTMRNKTYVADDNSNLFVLDNGDIKCLGVDEIIQSDSRFQYLTEIREGELRFFRGKSLLSITEQGVKEVELFEGENFLKVGGCMSDFLNIEYFNLLGNYRIVGRRGILQRKDFMFIEDSKVQVVLGDDGSCYNVVGDSKYAYDKRPLVGEDKLFAGNNSNLLRIMSSSFDTLWRSDSVSISALYTLNDSTFFLGTQFNGLLKLSLTADTFRLKNLFSSKSVQEITKDPLGKFWAATYSGAYRFSEDGKVEVHLSKMNGLPSSETYDLDFFSDSVALGTAKGLALFAQEYMPSVEPHIPDRYVQVVKIKVGDVRVENDGFSLLLNPGENDLEVDFSLLHPGSMGNINYDIQLQPYDREPIRQKERSVRYSQLNPGKYIFTVSATALDGSVYSLEQPLNIHVKQYLFKQTWLQVLGLLLFGALVWYFIHRREKDKYRKASEELDYNRRISELQLEALRSQMNPHFVFNALGSIQYYIQSEEKELADNYLTKFALLMRKYLDSSKRNLVTVGEEVALLTQYIELEQMRFDHAFTYQFIIDDQVDDSDSLPSMILQPFVENAIIHGLANRSNPGGKVEVSISIEGDSTVVVIADNGVGMENSSKLKRRGHRSRATEITNERINALRNAGNAEISLVYSTLDLNSPDCPGTKATLRINMHPDEN